MKLHRLPLKQRRPILPQAGSKRRSRPARKPLPEDLPREVVTHLPPHNCCPDCGGALRQFGEDVSEQLERIPATFKVIRHVRPKFACAGCERVVEAPAPARPIERGLPGPALLAHVLVSKYADHSPLYRQSEIFAREGVDLDRSTLAGWVGAASELLAPLVDEIRKHVLAASKIHADDTPVPVLAPGNGKTKTGRLWTYVRDDRPAGYTTAPAVWFAYSEDRKGEHPRRHLKNFKGALAGRCLRRLPSSLWRRRHLRSRVLGSRQTQVPRHPCGSRLAHHHRGTGPHRRALCNRGGDSRQARRSSPLDPSGTSQAAAR